MAGESSSVGATVKNSNASEAAKVDLDNISNLGQSDLKVATACEACDGKRIWDPITNF